ncbi:MAG: translocase FtsK [Bacillales bacterium]|jgi:S-DNA-T family DNA segregation ATPase FtsK/SpoIIIE|nr:translocase FtsK [Bacillales bacterium]
MVKHKRRRKKISKSTLLSTIRFEIVGLLLLGFSIVALAKLGAISTAFRLIAQLFMGDWEFVLLLGLLGLSIYLMIKRQIPAFFSRQFFGGYLLIASILILAHISAISNEAIPYDDTHRSIVIQTWKHYWANVIESKGLDLGGGMLGAILYATFHFLFDTAGSKIIAIITAIIGGILLTGLSFKETSENLFLPIVNFLKKQSKEMKSDIKRHFESPVSSTPQPIQDTDIETVEPKVDLIVDSTHDPGPKIQNFADNIEIPDDHFEEIPVKKEEVVFSKISLSELENLDYMLPPLTLLNHSRRVDQSGAMQKINENAKKLEQTLQDFGVKAKVTQIYLGPAVTQYEVYPEAGVKVSKIVSLTDDIALALAAKDIRIEAPIPGKSAVGIEVPNSETSMVSLREVLEEQSVDKRGGLLKVTLGRDISGSPISAELNKMPHLLVAGSTGSGKSVCINGIITSILMRAKPHEVKMMMIDPKMVELNMYNGIPHLLTPVVTEPKRAAQALKKVVVEMERRYELFSTMGIRNIEGFNDQILRHNLEEELKQPILPFIVVIVDELADLMLVASSEVEDAIMRLAQMGRAAGIHLIIATQRPSVDVITGVIKANIPSRIAFAVSSSVDSRTILDMGGAEKLLGKGDMLFIPVGASKPTRIQGAFLSDSEVEKVVEYVSTQQKAQYQEDMIPDIIEENVQDSSDELYEEAVRMVVDMQTASVSLLQRRFRIGYSRAARLIDEMETNGVVGPYEGSKPRTVLVPKNQN